MSPRRSSGRSDPGIQRIDISESGRRPPRGKGPLLNIDAQVALRVGLGGGCLDARGLRLLADRPASGFDAGRARGPRLGCLPVADADRLDAGVVICVPRGTSMPFWDGSIGPCDEENP